MLTERQVFLTNLLIKQNGYKTVKYFAQLLNVSERTVHSDLEQISNSLLNKGFQLDKKSGKGIALKRTDKTTTDRKIRTITLAKFSRRKEIIELMLFEEKIVTFEYLSTLFSVSKSSIEQDLKFVKQLLTSNNNLQVISDAGGTRLSGLEKEIQKAYLNFNFFVFEANLGILDDGDERLAILSHYYGEQNVKTCFRVLYSHVRFDNNFIAEHYIFNVLNMLVIMVYRAQKNQHIDDAIAINDNSQIFQNNAKSILSKISLRLNFTFSNGDINYLAKYLLSNRIDVFSSDKNNTLLVDKIISNVGSSLFIDFRTDNKLRDYLIQHMPPMLYRLREGIKINNPFVTQVKQDFPVLFNIIWIIASKCEDELGVFFNDDEIGFLTIHFQSAIERAKHSKKILVVCQNGIATTELLVNRITSVLPSLTTIEVASVHELNADVLANIDLIISTINLTIDGVKVVVVSPLLSEQDIQNIFNIYGEHFVLNDHIQEHKHSFLYLIHYLEKDTLFLNQNFNSKEELINEIGQKLVTQQIVMPDFIQGMIVREGLGATELPTGVAIPHGNPKFVKQTRIVMVTNSKAIKWNDNLVKMIIIICISEKDIKNLKKILSDIYLLVKSKSLINQLCETPNHRKFIQFIKGAQDEYLSK